MRTVCYSVDCKKKAALKYRESCKYFIFYCLYPQNRIFISDLNYTVHRDTIKHIITNVIGEREKVYKRTKSNNNHNFIF